MAWQHNDHHCPNIQEASFKNCKGSESWLLLEIKPRRPCLSCSALPQSYITTGQQPDLSILCIYYTCIILIASVTHTAAKHACDIQDSMKLTPLNLLLLFLFLLLFFFFRLTTRIAIFKEAFQQGNLEIGSA